MSKNAENTSAYRSQNDTGRSTTLSPKPLFHFASQWAKLKSLRECDIIILDKAKTSKARPAPGTEARGKSTTFLAGRIESANAETPAKTKARQRILRGGTSRISKGRTGGGQGYPDSPSTASARRQEERPGARERRALRGMLPGSLPTRGHLSLDGRGLLDVDPDLDALRP
ncbi:hypothetical protein KM043_007493 [Ampulex compressa]|nr:hypothetical protein KM043_007493 [Ampulex compressa]